MDKVVHCHCGFDARAEHEDELVADVQRHASEAHGMALTHDEALLLVFRAELDCGVHARSETHPDTSRGRCPTWKEEG